MPTVSGQVLGGPSSSYVDRDPCHVGGRAVLGRLTPARRPGGTGPASTPHGGGVRRHAADLKLPLIPRGCPPPRVGFSKGLGHKSANIATPPPYRLPCAWARIEVECGAPRREQVRWKQ